MPKPNSAGVNRRAFIARCATAIAGVAVAAHVPMPVVRAVGLEPWAAAAYLTRVYNAHARKARPVVMHAGDTLFDAFEADLPLLWRFSPNDDRPAGPRALRFKAVKLYRVGTGWRAEVVESEPYSRNARNTNAIPQ